MRDPGRILIRATNWIGDAVMSLPAVRQVRARFPEAHVALLARPWVADIYREEPAVDEILIAPSAPVHQHAREWLAVARQIGKRGFDAALLLPNSFESALLARLAAIPEIVGYDRDGRGLLLTRSVPAPRAGEIPSHERFYYLELLRRAGWLDKLPEAEPILFENCEAAAVRGQEAFTRLGLRLPVIGVSPGAAFGTAKRWLPERFAEAAATLAALHGAAVCLFGAVSERALCDSVAGQIRELAPRVAVQNAAGQTSLRSFMDMAAAALVFLTNDSGAMHLASALGTPTVTVFGATNPVTTGPSGPFSVIVREPQPCSPCFQRECPIDHRCMTGVSAAQVVVSADQLLSAHSKSWTPVAKS